MTKEQVLQYIDEAIHHIHQHFCEEECECILTNQLVNAKLPFEWSIEHGITKAVLLIKGAPFVIKFPFIAFYDSDGYDDAHWYWSEARDRLFEDAINNKRQKTGNEEILLTEEEIYFITETFCEDNPEPEGSDTCWYVELEGATYADLPALKGAPDWNYCNLEVEIYQEAVRQGLGAYFAEEGCLGILNCGHPVYYQQRCTPLSVLEYDYSTDEYQKKSRSARKTCEDNEIYCFNPLWIADFLEQYGIEEFKHLNAFIKEMDIGDLRDCNIGYLDGAPILFDYSGFRHWN